MKDYKPLDRQTESPLLRIARKLGLEGRYFFCPKCQIKTQGNLFRGPAATMLPFDALVEDCNHWRCLDCRAAGTAATARRLVSESVDLAVATADARFAKRTA